jgi:hypothetical protein
VTRALDPEIKSIRRLDRAARTVPPNARQRVLEWLVARECGLGAITLPPVRPAEAPDSGAVAHNPKQASS